MHDQVAVGITTAQRPEPYLSRTLASLRQTGYQELIRVRAEPGVDITDNAVAITRNSEQQGCFRNWRCLAWQLLQETTQPWLLMLQDDVVFVPGMWDKLSPMLASKTQDSRVGFVSLYTNRSMRPREIYQGWGLANYHAARGYWGALACCWRRESLQRTLDIGCIQRPEHSHPAGIEPTAYRKVDVLIGRACLELSLQIHTPYPSLTDHIGEHSTIGRDLIPGIQAGRRGIGFQT